MKYPQYKLQSEIEDSHWWHAGKRKILSSLARRVLDASKKPLVVDIGCGTGGNIAAFSPDYDCVGIDPSPDAIGFARERYPHVRFVCGQAAIDLGPVAGQADLFILSDVLEHIEDEKAFFSRLVEQAKAGAYFLITVPADMSLWSQHDVSLGHYRRYDRAGFEAVIAGLPLSVRLMSHYNTRLYPVVKMVRLMTRWRGKAWGDADTDIKKTPAPLNWALQKIFAGEEKVLASALDGKADGYSFGISLIALLQKKTQ